MKQPSKEPLYKALMTIIYAMHTCKQNSEAGGQNSAHYGAMYLQHRHRIEQLVKNHLPSGSGFDTGTTIDVETSYRRSRLVMDTAFHHHGEHGYDGWTNHTVTAVPDLALTFWLKINGRNRNDIKGYISDVFSAALLEVVEVPGIDLES